MKEGLDLAKIMWFIFEVSSLVACCFLAFYFLGMNIGNNGMRYVLQMMDTLKKGAVEVRHDQLVEGVRKAFAAYPEAMKNVRFYLLKTRGKPVGTMRGEPELTQEEKIALMNFGVIRYSKVPGRSQPVMVASAGVLNALDRFSHDGQEIGAYKSASQSAPPSSRRSGPPSVRKASAPPSHRRVQAVVDGESPMTAAVARAMLTEDDDDEITLVMRPKEIKEMNDIAMQTP